MVSSACVQTGVAGVVQHLPLTTRSLSPVACRHSLRQSPSPNHLITMDDVDEHYLDSYLTDILPALGLDVEAYGPYVTSFMKEGSDDDVDSLDELIDLLRASSETHSEDDSAWETFRKEITQRRVDYIKGEDLRKEMHALDIQAATRANLQKEVEISQKNAHELEARKRMELESEKLENMSEAKIALMAKYGYEDEDDADDDIGHGDEDAETPKTNREHAAAMSLQKAQKQKSANVQTKQEARQETAKAKNDKLAKKEERRKKAEKRERQR